MIAWQYSSSPICPTRESLPTINETLNRFNSWTSVGRIIPTAKLSNPLFYTKHYKALYLHKTYWNKIKHVIVKKSVGHILPIPIWAWPKARRPYSPMCNINNTTNDYSTSTGIIPRITRTVLIAHPLRQISVNFPNFQAFSTTGMQTPIYETFPKPPSFLLRVPPLLRRKSAQKIIPVGVGISHAVPDVGGWRRSGADPQLSWDLANTGVLHQVQVRIGDGWIGGWRVCVCVRQARQPMGAVTTRCDNSGKNTLTPSENCTRISGGKYLELEFGHFCSATT